MSDDFYDFDLEPNVGMSIPDWAFRKFRCRAFRSAVEAAGGPIPVGESLQQAFHYQKDVINKAAYRKIAALDGVVDDPVPIVAADIAP